MQLFYFPRTSSETIELPADESRHLVKVLRKKVGDIVHATDGEGFLIKAKLLDENHRGVQLQKLEEEKQPESAYEFTLAIAPVKNNDRLEWCIEKATEIGVTRIVPILCDHAERKRIKHDRLERTAVSAMKQSNQFYKPQIDELTKFKDFVEQDNGGEKYIAHCEEDRERTQFVSQVKPGGSTTILIGPEGDFSPQEIELALKCGYLPVALGNTRLRTETAAVVSTAIVASKNID